VKSPRPASRRDDDRRPGVDATGRGSQSPAWLEEWDSVSRSDDREDRRRGTPLASSIGSLVTFSIPWAPLSQGRRPRKPDMRR
jgi:hypothetical protein